MRRKFLLLLLLTTLLADTARAGIFFNRTPTPPKPAPTERVPQLLKELKESGDENKRGAAVDELRQFDLQAFPQIVPAIIDALINDKKPYVRAEAAQTLGKLRPMMPEIATALETARDKDESMRVRLQARSALMSYQWSGYRGPQKITPTPAPTAAVVKTPAAPTTKEPPLANPALIQRAAPVPNPVPVITTSSKPMKDDGPELPPPN